MYWLEMKVIRHRMKERIEESMDPTELVEFTFSLENGEVVQEGFVFLRPDKEFEFQGHRFDIVHQQLSDSTVTYWVLEDEMEERLVAAFQGNPDPDNPATNARRAFLKFFDKSFPHPSPQLEPPLGAAQVHHAGDPDGYSPPTICKKGPPPRA